MLAFIFLVPALFVASIPTTEPATSLALRVFFVAVAGGLSSLAQVALARQLVTFWANWLSGMTGPVATTLFGAWLLGSIATSGSTLPAVVVGFVALGLVLTRAVVLPWLDRRWGRRGRRQAALRTIVNAHPSWPTGRGRPVTEAMACFRSNLDRPRERLNGNRYARRRLV